MKCHYRRNPDNLSGLKAGGQGVEPRLTVPETAVLPLDEPPPVKEILSFLSTLVKSNQKSMLKFVNKLKLKYYHSLLKRRLLYV